MRAMKESHTQHSAYSMAASYDQTLLRPYTLIPKEGSWSLAVFPGPLSHGLTRWSCSIFVLGSDCEGVLREGSQTGHIGLTRATLNIHGPRCLGYRIIHGDVVASDKWDVVRVLHPLNED